MKLAARYTITVVSDSMYGLDAKAFEKRESEILIISSSFLKPRSNLRMNQVLTSIYPFLNKFRKIISTQLGSVEFFTKIMENAINKRSESKIVKGDYLEYLMNLTNKKEITLNDLATHGVSFLADG